MGFVFYNKYTTEQKDIEIHRNNENGVLILKVLQNSVLYLHGSNLIGGLILVIHSPNNVSPCVCVFICKF